ncbi:cell division topological specificity factor MinE [Clostridium mediterraneense]|uniref:cell division topological specificity factor MinE n=1 Tax=Clostridium mediterraneense TaxID=1805472 RepID=UPI000829E370|nr:cell division topological specificity factor MinE [Clostridium mediterraneense]
MFKFFSSKPSPKQVAKDRLKLILIHDRGELSPTTLEKIRREIYEVLAKYVDIDDQDIDIAVTKSTDMDGEMPSLIANIPIKNLRGR